MSANVNPCPQFNPTLTPSGHYRLADGSLRTYADRGIQIRWTDEGPGGDVLSVPLSKCGKTAMICAEDFQRTVLEHGDGPWFLNDDGKGHSYVRMTSRIFGNNFSVARAVIGDNRQMVARYRNGDRTDLRRENVWPEGRKRQTARVTGAAAGAHRAAEAGA
jgi:hypothetical protein